MNPETVTYEADIQGCRWWAIHEADLLAMLRAAHDGTPPLLVIAEQYANARHEHITDDE